jgi:hypothetical protein
VADLPLGTSRMFFATSSCGFELELHGASRFKHSSNPQIAKYILVDLELSPSQRSPRQGRELEAELKFKLNLELAALPVVTKSESAAVPRQLEGHAIS